MASFFLNEMWKWSVRDTHFYSAEILKKSVPFQPWNLFGCTEIGQVTLEFLTVCIYIILRCWQFLWPAKKHAENVFLFSLIVLTTVCFDDPQCWGTLQIFCMGYELVGITAGDISAACWGKRRSLTLPRYVVWPFMLFMCGGTFLCWFLLNILTLKNGVIYLFIISIFFPLLCSQFNVIRSKINAVVVYMYFESIYCHICSLSCATGYARFNVLIFLFPFDQH